MMQLAKKVPFEDPQVLMAVRGLYILSNVLILGLHLYTQAKINAKKGMWLIACDHVLPPLVVAKNAVARAPTFQHFNVTH
jgi:hypothetical protein